MHLTKRLVRHEMASGGEVWFNALTGAADRLSSKEVAEIETALSQEQAVVQPALIDKLKDRGYLFSDSQQEEAVFQKLLKQQLVERSQRVSLIVCPTYSCNLRCVYCFEHRSHPNLTRQIMSLEMLEQTLAAFRHIRSLYPEGRYSMGLFGGEPLLPATRGVVTGVLAAAESDRLPVMITSNGTHVAGFLPQLKRYAEQIKAIQLTLDGPSDVHDQRRPRANGSGTYNAVVAGIDQLLKLDMHVVLRVNIDRANVGQLPQLTQLVHRRGWSENPQFTASLAPVRDHIGSGAIPNVTSDAELLEALFAIYDQDPATEALFGIQGFSILSPMAGLLHEGTPSRPRLQYCEANYGGFWVAGPDGFLYACPEAIGQPELAIGSYAPEFELWPERMSQWVGRNIGSLDRCHDCEVGALCGGGCTYAALACHGDSTQAVCDSDLERAVRIFLERRVLTT